MISDLRSLRRDRVQTMAGKSKEDDPRYLWGETGTNRLGSPLTLTQQERESLMKIQKFLNLEGPIIYQPGEEEDRSTGPTFASPKETQIQDEWVLGGIRLLNYKSEILTTRDNLVRLKELGSANPGFTSRSIEIPQLPHPVLPKEKSLSRKEGLFVNPSPGSDIDTKENIDLFDSDQTKSEDNAESPPLSSTVVRQLMHKSVAAIAAFYGFDQSTEEALNVLTDVGCQFTRHFCQMLRLSRDNQLLGNSTGFSDVLERTFRDMSLGSVLDIRDFYANSVIGCYKSIRTECQVIADECHSLASSSGPQFSGHSFESNLGLEPGVSESLDNIPEIHFPSSDEGDLATFSIDHNTPQMETGLQMLQSLEQGTYVGNGSNIVDDNSQPLSQESTSGIMLGSISPLQSRKRQKT